MDQSSNERAEPVGRRVVAWDDSTRVGHRQALYRQAIGTDERTQRFAEGMFGDGVSLDGEAGR